MFKVVNGCLVDPKTWDLIIGIFGTRFGRSRSWLRTVIGPCVIYTINYGFGVFWPEMAMDFGSTKWNQSLVRGLSTDSPLLVLGTVKNSLGFACWTENGPCVL